MKKTLLTIALVSAVAFANAQDMMSKKGTPILPEEGDWSLGISVNPFFDYFGNMFNGSFDNSSPSWDFANSNQAIFGRMVMADGKAYRGSVRLGFGSNSYGTGDTTSGNLKDSSVSSSNIVLSLGIQQSRGKGRLQGYYGAEASILFGGGRSTDYTYNGTAANSAVASRSDGSTFGIGVRGFIGAEYFFAPKISLSGEFGWGIGFKSTGAGETETVGGTKSETGDSSSFTIDTDNAGGQIMLNFYF
jgi:hypothetical protein